MEKIRDRAGSGMFFYEGKTIRREDCETGRRDEVLDFGL